jgi:hypothetical protein
VGRQTTEVPRAECQLDPGPEHEEIPLMSQSDDKRAAEQANSEQRHRWEMAAAERRHQERMAASQQQHQRDTGR